MLRLPLLASSPAPDELLFRSLHADPRRSLGSLMTADELAIVASLPQHELRGTAAVADPWNSLSICLRQKTRPCCGWAQ